MNKYFFLKFDLHLLLWILFKCMRQSLIMSLKFSFFSTLFIYFCEWYNVKMYYWCNIWFIFYFSIVTLWLILELVWMFFARCILRRQRFFCRFQNQVDFRSKSSCRYISFDKYNLTVLRVAFELFRRFSWFVSRNLWIYSQSWNFNVILAEFISCDSWN